MTDEAITTIHERVEQSNKMQEDGVEDSVRGYMLWVRADEREDVEEVISDWDDGVSLYSDDHDRFRITVTRHI